LDGSQKEEKIKYIVDHVFPCNSSQNDVYSMLKHKFDLVCKGWKVSVIAYGMTGSGKTHTMVGDNGSNDGLINSALQHFFNT